MTRKTIKTTYLAQCGLFAALTAICSWISVPLPFTPIPVNLATLAVFLAGGLLGPKYGSLSITVYALAGAVGVPVFAGFRGGLGVLAGPTGGFVVGYIAAAFITGIIIYTISDSSSVAQAITETHTTDTTHMSAKSRWLPVYVLAMSAGQIACYFLGTVWFIVSTGTGVGSALILCVVPFIPGDVLKIIAGTILIRKLRRFV